jgi:hypothetical protein
LIDAANAAGRLFSWDDVCVGVSFVLVLVM